jgi:hypothetical protein
MDKEFIENFGGNLLESSHLEDQNGNGRITCGKHTVKDDQIQLM